MSIGGADARHFHPITQIPSDDLELPPVTGGGEGSTSPPSDDVPLMSGEGKTRDGASRVSGEGSGERSGVAGGRTAPEGRVTGRVLRVHTGGVHGSSVSLPVPRSEGGGGGEGARENGE